LVDTLFKIDGGITGFVLSLKAVDNNFVLRGSSIIDFIYNFIVLVLLLEILGGIKQ
jgi:hypothetical protein